MTSDDNRGPLENLYELKFPNCDKHGLYNLKQVCHGQSTGITPFYLKMNLKKSQKDYTSSRKLSLLATHFDINILQFLLLNLIILLACDAESLNPLSRALFSHISQLFPPLTSLHTCSFTILTSFNSSIFSAPVYLSALVHYIESLFTISSYRLAWFPYMSSILCLYIPIISLGSQNFKGSKSSTLRGPVGYTLLPHLECPCV